MLQTSQPRSVFMPFGAGRSIGSVTSTSVPAPTALRTSIRPPWLSTMRFAIGSPRPLPLVETLRPR